MAVISRTKESTCFFVCTECLKACDPITDQATANHSLSKAINDGLDNLYAPPLRQGDISSTDNATSKAVGRIPHCDWSLHEKEAIAAKFNRMEKILQQIMRIQKQKHTDGVAKGYNVALDCCQGLASTAIDYDPLLNV